MGELCHEASAQRLHDLAKREPLTLSELEAAQQQALGRSTEVLQAAVLKAGDAVASACSKALDHLDATMIDFRTKQVRALRVLLQQLHTCDPMPEYAAHTIAAGLTAHVLLLPEDGAHARDAGNPASLSGGLAPAAIASNGSPD